jgi:hypothetical protein
MMKMKASILFVMLLFSVNGFGQVTFQKAYGGTGDYDVGNSVQQTTDGGYIITGRTRSYGAGNDDVYLIKTDSTGDTLWSKTFGGANTDIGHSVGQTADGGYIISSLTNSFGAGSWNIYLIKTNSSGSIDWAKVFSGTSSQYGYDVQQTTDGGYIIAGHRFGGASDAYLIKTNTVGDTIWTKAYGGIGGDYAFAVQQINDGGYILAGQTNNSFGNSPDIFLVRTDSTGSLVWAKIIDHSTTESANDVQQTFDGGFIIVGETDFYGNGFSDIYLVKTDSTGSVMWTRTFGGPVYLDGEVGYAVRQCIDGGFIITGYSGANTATGVDVCLVRTDSSGNMLWTKSYGEIGDERGFDLQLTADGGFIVTGQTRSFGAGLRDIFLLKTDSSGSSICIEPNTSIFTIQNTNQLTVSSVVPTITFGGTITIPATQSGNGVIVNNSCIPTTAEELNKYQNLFSLSPNPATSEIIIHPDASGRIQHVEIVSVLGQQVYNSAFDILHSALTIDVSSLGEGIYFVTVRDEKGNRATRKFVKM